MLNWDEELGLILNWNEKLGLILNWDQIGSKDRQTDTQTNGHYQVHYLPASLSYVVNKNEMYRKWFMLMAKMEAVDQWYNALCIPYIGGNSPGLKYYTHDLQ